MSVTFSPNDILSNQTRPTATPSPSSASSAPVTFNADDVVSNQTQAAKPAAPAPPTNTIGPAPNIWDAKASDFDNGDIQHDAINHMTMPLIKALVAAHDKLREAETLTQTGREAHPIQAKLGEIADGIQGFLFGGAQNRANNIGSGKYGMLNNPVTSAIIPGGGTEAEPALASGIRGVKDVIQGGVTTAREALAGKSAASSLPAGSSTPFQRINPFRKLVMSPEAVGAAESQPAAQAAVRTALGAAPDAPILKDATTIADQPIKDLYTQAKQEYKKVDDLVGFDLKAEKLALSNDQYNLKQLGNTEADNAARIKLNASIKDSTNRIADAEAQLKTAGVDPKQADNIFRAGRAGDQFKTLLVRATNPDGTVKVDSLLNGSKVLRFNPKYGDRLAQFFAQGGDPGAGKAAADGFIADLQAAQKTGQKAMASRALRNLVLKYVVPAAGTGLAAATGYELAK